MFAQCCELVLARRRTRFHSDMGSILTWNDGRLTYARAKSSLQSHTTTHEHAKSCKIVHSHALSCAFVHFSAAAGIYAEIKVVRLMFKLR